MLGSMRGNYDIYSNEKVPKLFKKVGVVFVRERASAICYL